MRDAVSLRRGPFNLSVSPKICSLHVMKMKCRNSKVLQHLACLVSGINLINNLLLSGTFMHLNLDADDYKLPDIKICLSSLFQL